MILSCAIIDDEPLATDLLASYVKKTANLTLRGAYNSAISAMGELRDNPVDILFLDIHMPELNGLELARLVPKETKIIITTAFDQYAVDGYKANVFDYMLKPISYEMFLDAVRKVETVIMTIKKQDLFTNDRFIYVKSDYKLVQIHLDDILYIEGLKDYVKIYLEGNKKGVMSLINMKRIDEFLPHPEFLRVHRSYIVHMNKVKLVDRARIVFSEEYIPISESYKDVVQDYLDAHTLM
ncbi:MAG: response regulator transcription factor [Prevotella sp.]|nr:response regulator transcription factor [Prevotella sp.]